MEKGLFENLDCFFAFFLLLWAHAKSTKKSLWAHTGRTVGLYELWYKITSHDSKQSETKFITLSSQKKTKCPHLSPLDPKCLPSPPSLPITWT